MDIITVVSKKFLRRSKKMMMRLMAVTTGNVIWMTTAHENKFAFDRQEWIA